MLKELRDFLFKSNVFDLAVAVIMAVAFGAVVTAFTEGIVMALVAAIVGKPDFNALTFELNGTPILYGRVLTALVNLVLIGTSLFLMVKLVKRLSRETKKVPETDHDLLAQIRDELRSRPVEPHGLTSS
ncbi:MAG TPA: large conductance mechanosensitive channel protein MscL [Kofleriaceae bacterium]|nr:large conductance mechanosensitive channel protein MscL [Kofleriaceae bacterium]